MAKKRKKSQKPKLPTPIEAYKHEETRSNIPTKELRDFVTEDEQEPQIMLYPRDPSLDPQLVWQGKDEQDSQDLAVPAVPIYIQEKINPRVIVEEVRKQARENGAEPPLPLFDDFNGIAFEDMIEFYQHQQNWTNRMILGDSLLAMTSLAEKEGLRGKVQMIYIDPPYGIQFGSNWQISTRKKQVKDGKSGDVTRQPEQIRAFRDTWQLGIHSYLPYLRDRFVLARELLTESGSLFIQMGDENVHLVRALLDEIFGIENFVAQIYFKTTTGRQEQYLDRVGNYILWFAKDATRMKYRDLFIDKNLQGDHDYSLGDLQSQGVRSTGSYPVTFRGQKYQPLASNHWKVTEDGLQRLITSDRVEALRTVIRYRRYGNDFPVQPLSDVWTDTSGGAGADKVYVVQTSRKIVERCLLMSSDPGDIVLDPTCGSGTTAYVAEQWGRRWITMDTSRVALALARTRLMAARYPYYLLSDSPEGIQKEAELTGQYPPDYQTANDLRKGFVYERAPHITLGAIANNPEIDTLYADWLERMEPLRADLNAALGTNWEEWEIPRDADEGWSTEAHTIHEKWWEARLARQQEIDASIARNADYETLYDRPYEDKKRLRVSGPFTTESLSPHRMLTPDESRPVSESEAQANGNISFDLMIIDNLKRVGVQNGFRGERLVFDFLDPYAGEYIQAAGEHTDADGNAHRVAVAIGPEHGTVNPVHVKEAAKEAVQGIGFDMLVVCGFAFDPHVSEEVKRYGELQVLPAHMNPDLVMDELLKKTGTGNLFMVFGEPDIEWAYQDDGQMVVQIHGLDVYDPTTGQVRNSSTDDIAAWFIDTNYNGESFFVRHAYFTGEGDPYKRLKQALRAEIDADAWAQLYSTVSYPFDAPETGQIAVKVINHYGDEC